MPFPRHSDRDAGAAVGESEERAAPAPGGAGASLLGSSVIRAHFTSR